MGRRTEIAALEAVKSTGTRRLYCELQWADEEEKGGGLLHKAKQTHMNNMRHEARHHTKITCNVRRDDKHVAQW